MNREGSLRAYVGVTDWDWYEFLRARHATEVNFWQPSGGRRFGAILPASPFLFKTHYSRGNRIVGAGFFSGWASLPMTRAWEFFGPDNGCSSLAQMRTRPRNDGGVDPEVGCVMLRDVSFFNPADAPAAPSDWSPNIVQGRSYDLASPEGGYIEEVLMALLGQHLNDEAIGLPTTVTGETLGAPRLRPVRLGQAAFKALVQEAYGRRCAVTGDKIVPVLQAAHIRPVTAQGEHRVDNGLLLRSDVHTLFDRGYLSVHPERMSLMVSPRLRADLGNGDEFYARAEAGGPISLPGRRADQPNQDFLTWHVDEIFLAS